MLVEVHVMELTEPQKEVLHILSKNGGSGTVKSVARELDSTSVYAWRLLNALIGKGLVEKVDWGFYRLTSKGWAVLNARDES